MMANGGTGGGVGGEPKRHIPVLLQSVLEALKPADGETYIDGTFGAGGYSRAILESANCQVIGIDRDPVSLDIGRELEKAFPQQFTIVEGCFSDLQSLAGNCGKSNVDGVVLDIGVSSMQLDTPERGFSFQAAGPLDMRMGTSGSTAAEILADLSEKTLAEILFKLGEEKRSRAIARAIVRQRQEQPVTTTKQLADLVAAVIGRRKDGINPATRTFQALRIFVNQELEELANGLAAAEKILAPGGRLVVVSFHSLEDRIVKNFLTRRSGNLPLPSRHRPEEVERPVQSFQLVNRKAVKPTEEEVGLNPRARSARLRAAVRTGEETVPLDFDSLG
ncbi:MAG: 16S rRNA (cytosine(1402)-N(4))-methyltransferase RsmH, partial [Methyloligellaceae bacterium]